MMWSFSWVRGFDFTADVPFLYEKGGQWWFEDGSSHRLVCDALERFMDGRGLDEIAGVLVISGRARLVREPEVAEIELIDLGEPCAEIEGETFLLPKGVADDLHENVGVVREAVEAAMDRECEAVL